MSLKSSTNDSLQDLDSLKLYTRAEIEPSKLDRTAKI